MLGFISDAFDEDLIHLSDKRSTKVWITSTKCVKSVESNICSGKLSSDMIPILENKPHLCYRNKWFELFFFQVDILKLHISEHLTMKVIKLSVWLCCCMSQSEPKAARFDTFVCAPGPLSNWLRRCSKGKETQLLAKDTNFCGDLRFHRWILFEQGVLWVSMFPTLQHPLAMLCEHEGVFWMQVELPTNVEIERKWASLRVNKVGTAHRVLVKNAAAILFTRQIHSMQPSRQFAKHLRQGQLFKGKKWIVPESLMEISSHWHLDRNSREELNFSFFFEGS